MSKAHQRSPLGGVDGNDSASGSPTATLNTPTTPTVVNSSMAGKMLRREGNKLLAVQADAEASAKRLLSLEAEAREMQIRVAKMEAEAKRQAEQLAQALAALAMLRVSVPGSA